MDRIDKILKPFEDRFRTELERVRKLIDEYEEYPERFESMDDVETGPILRRLEEQAAEDEP